MVKTFPLDMILSQGLGMAFSLAQGEKEEEAGSVFASTYFKVGLVFHLVVAFGVAFLCYILYPDWMLMYFADDKKIPKGVIAYIFSLYFGMYVLGFLEVPHLKKVKEELPWVVFVGVNLLSLVFIALTFHRLWYVGDYGEYHSGNAKPITRTALFPVLGSAMPAAIGGLLATIRALDRRFQGRIQA